MGSTYGFAILAEELNPTIKKIITLVKKSEDKYIVEEEGVFPINFYIKPDIFKMYGLTINYFKIKEKNKLKIFVEISSKNRIYQYDGKQVNYDFIIFDEINKILNKGKDKDKIWIFPFYTNGGIKKTKPKIIIEKWKGKFI